jgi:thymidylate synthase
MNNPYFPGGTLDDVMRSVINEIVSRGVRINPTKGPAAEVNGVLLELTNPRARLSRTETRGKPFSCLGELCWYLAGTNDAEFISYYIPDYRQYADANVVFGGYGPRLFTWRGLNQLHNVTAILKQNPDSRKAVIQLFDASDIVEDHKDVPCTCTLQFMIRGDALHLFANMRSNDAFLGLPHDCFCFTMLQEIMARTLSIELGTYKHAVGSLHIYDRNRSAAQQFLAEGWQSTIAMPPMPTGNPWPAIDALRKAELTIRTKDRLEVAGLESLDPYWADLVRLLRVFRHLKDDEVDGIKALRNNMSSEVYHLFIDHKLRQL